jgi:hypothetical protein
MKIHTPGPWQVHSDHSPYDLTIIGNVDGPLEDGFYNYSTVCDVADTADADGNLALIAAAPELLEALHAVLNSDMAMREEDEGNVSKVLNKVRAAIAKATS